MNYKKLKNYLIAIDLDNTIITGFDNYDKKTFKILRQLAKNNYVVIATGRPWRSSQYFYNLLGLNTPVINYNGSYVHNPCDDSFPETLMTIDRFKLNKFIRDNENILVNLFCERKDNIYLLHDTDSITPYLHLQGGKLKVGDFSEILPENSNGAIVFSRPGSENDLNNYIEKYYNDVKIRHWFTRDMLVSELYNPKVSKANALEVVRKYYNIEKSKTIAIGDSHNDIEMIEWANIGVAMQDAPAEVLAKANFVTLSVKESGVGDFFKKHSF